MNAQDQKLHIPNSPPLILSPAVSARSTLYADSAWLPYPPGPQCSGQSAPHTPPHPRCVSKLAAALDRHGCSQYCLTGARAQV